MTMSLSRRAAATHPSNATGAALVITLSVLVLVTVLLVGLSATLRLERGAAASHFERSRAELFAQYGVEEVVATLQTQTADPSRYWISQPGQIVAGSPGVAWPLHSGTATQADAPDLNVRTLAETGHLVSETVDANTGKAVRMPLNWVYVFKEENVPPGPLPGAGTPVGRYAYWTDDESAKVNFNLAWTRSAANPNPYSHPSQVSLAAIFSDVISSSARAEELARAVHFFRATPPPPDPFANPGDYNAIKRTFFNTREDAARVGAADDTMATDLRAAFKAAKFEVSHYNSDPDTTFFNEPRIVLTTDSAKANGRPYLNILKTGNPDPGALSSLDTNKLNTSLQLLIQYLERSDWPMAAGSSFQKKYYGDSKQRLTQLAINIIDYVRSAESARNIVEPIRGYYVNGKFTIGIGSAADDTYMGATRAPMITEMAYWMSNQSESRNTEQGVKTLYPCKFYIEIYLPENYGLAEIPLVGDVEPSVSGVQRWGIYNYEPRSGHIYYDGKGRLLKSNSETPNRGGILLGSGQGDGQPYVLGGKTTLKAGEYATIVHDLYREKSQTERPRIYMKSQLRLGTETQDGFQDPNAIRISSAPSMDPPQGTPPAGGDPTAIVYNIDAPPIAETAITSVQCNDPRVNIVVRDWTQYGQMSNTLAGIHSTGVNTSNSVGNTPNTSIYPPQDADRDGKISQASLRMPAPKGSSENPQGQVRSSGELGFIHTGIEHQNTGAGVPWRTLRLQPTANSVAGEVPDWAFMDLFTAPLAVPSGGSNLYTPFGTSCGGRVNLNIKAVPLDGLERVRPLIAILQGSRKDSNDPASIVDAEEAVQIAHNIHNRQLAVHGVRYGFADGYDSPGEVVEIAGVADGGEESEELVRQMANLITTRSNVFTVYTIGQSLQPTTNGKLIVTGEQRQQVMIERYRPSSTSGEIRFRNLYFRNLNP